MNKHNAVPNRTLEMDVIDGRVRSRDPLQGQTGDCYLIASMAAVAQRHPDLVRSAISELPDGNLRIRLYEPYADASGAKKFRPVDVTVDKDVPSTAAGPVYARSANASWPALIEKAYASLQGNYQKIGYGGAPSAALEALTGKASAEVSTDGFRPEAHGALEMIQKAVQEGRPVVASTVAEESFTERMKTSGAHVRESAAYKTLAATADPASEHAFGKYGLVANHAYTVLGVGRRNGETMIVLRNPWGYFEPGRHGIASGEVQAHGGNGVFAIRADQFELLFDNVATTHD